MSSGFTKKTTETFLFTAICQKTLESRRLTKRLSLVARCPNVLPLLSVPTIVHFAGRTLVAGWTFVSYHSSTQHVMETMDPQKNLQSGHLTVFRQLFPVGFGNSSRVNPIFSLNQINESMSILYAFRCISILQSFLSVY